MKNTNTHSGFTLVELIVSIMIFGIMMISIMSIFLFSSQMSSRVELNRVMQENIKNVVEDIAENVRKNGIDGIRDFADPSCSMIDSSTPFMTGSTFCSGWDEYVLGTGTGVFLPVSDINECDDIASLCRVIKKESWWSFYPLTNSFVHFESISFTVTNSDVPMVVVNITARPSYNKWLSSVIVANNTMNIQTTISERLIETR